MNRNTPEDLVRELLQSNRNLTQDADDDNIRWITIHPFGMTQEEADTGEGKRYYQRIPVDKESGTIVGGLGNKLNGTNIKDLSENLKNVKEDKPLKMSDGEGGKVEKKEAEKPEQIKANSEAEKKNQEFIDKVKEVAVKDNQDEERFNRYKDKTLEYLNKYGDNAKDKAVIQKAFISQVKSDFFHNLDDVFKNLDSMPTEEAYQERKKKFDDNVAEVKGQLDELESKLNAVDVKDRRKTKYLNEIKRYKEILGEWAYGNYGIKMCRANIDSYEESLKGDKERIKNDLFRLANKWLKENEYMNYKVGEAEQKASESLAERRKERVEGMKERAQEIQKEGYARAEKGWEELHEIPFGQPNIAGRPDIYKRPTGLIDSGYAEVKRGEALERRAKGAEQALSNLRSDDPAIIPKLQEAIRNSTDSAERQRLRERLDTAIRTHERNQSGGGLNKKTKLYDLEENVTDGRIRFRFDGKPRQEVIDIMKSRGFKWSPSNKAWQRQNTPNGVYSAKKVIEELAQYEND